MNYAPLRRLLISLGVGTGLLLAVSCTLPPAQPTTAPAVAPTFAPATPTTAPATAPTMAPTVAAPTNTAAPAPVAASPTGETLRPAGAPTTAAATATPAGSNTTTNPGGFGSLKPSSGTTPQPTAVQKPASTPAAKVTPAAKTTPPPAQTATTGGQRKPVTGLTVAPTPTVTRKGVANSNVNPEKYVTEMVTDLLDLAAAMEEVSALGDAYDSGMIDEADLVEGFQQQAAIVRDLYVREVQRDYPPALKEIDDYYVESLRAATKMMDAMTLFLQTGDTKYYDEVTKQMTQFEFFANELTRRLGG